MNPKLVRNLIPMIISQEKKEDGSPRVPHFYQADDKEYWVKLKEKLSEEVAEFIDSEQVIELADILEVIDAIIEYKKVPFNELISLKEAKVKSHGTFSQRIILTSKD